MTYKRPAQVKSKLHPRNKNRERYDLASLVKAFPDLATYVRRNKHGDKSIDFADPEAVKTLNKAILKYHYKIDHWDIPKGYLCPPIPGRADYIHHIADLLAGDNDGLIPQGKNITCLDIGVGSSCIYPILGTTEYGWSFIASEIDPVSLESAQTIVVKNPSLAGHIDCRLQKNSQDFFKGILDKKECIDLSICNPPFHGSPQEAEAATRRKVNNLNLERSSRPQLNFGGKNRELWCKGGEEKFISDMIFQSKHFASSCIWFSTLVSKGEKLESVYTSLRLAGAVSVDTIDMGQGNKISRIVAWSFKSKDERSAWAKQHWQS